MVRSRLPLPSLLGLFAALLMLPPERLMGNAAEYDDLPFDDFWVQKCLAYSVAYYNYGRPNGVNFFKTLQLQKAQRATVYPFEYRLTVQLVKTACIKTGWKTYEDIEKCELLPGNQEKLNCYFVVRSTSVPFQIVTISLTCA